MKRIFALCLFLLLSSRAYPAVITGGETVYRVVEGDSLLLISAKLGANMKTIAGEQIDPDETFSRRSFASTPRKSYRGP
jgi:hypothetical protein